MRFNIQKFANWQENIEYYNNSIMNTQNELAGLDGEKQQLINDYNANYNNQLAEYENLQNQQQNYIDTWAETQKNTQQAQTDYNIGLINQNKEQAQKQTDAELGDAYIDYQKGLNQFGGNAEKMASSGLAGTGFSKNTEIAMNITYQNRVGTARAALTKAQTEYDNQIQQALLNNDASLAEIALQQYQQSMQLALQGFEYRDNLYNNKLAYEQDISDTYFNRSQSLKENINYYNSRLDTINQWQEEQDQWERSFAQQQKEHQDEMTKFWSEYNATYNSVYGDGSYEYGDGGSSQTPVTADDQYTYAKTVFGNDASTVNKKDYYFDNGYQPQYINNVKIGKTGVKVKEVFGNSLGSKIAEQNIWGANGKFYYWDGSAKDYVEIDGEALNKFKNQVSWWDKMWHKSV